MIPIIIAAIGAAQLAAGALNKKGKEKNRPGYDIPDEFDQNVALAKQVKGLGMPAEQYDAQKQAIDRGLGSGLYALQGRRGSISGIASLLQMSSDATLNLNATAASMRNRNFITGTSMQMDANAMKAQQKIKKMEWEKFQPFMRAVRQKEALIGAGMQNIVGGVSSYFHRRRR
jgi:hypothetical protein